MPNDYRIALGVIVTVGGIAYGVFYFPALTSGGGVSGSGASQARFEAAFSQEMDYCQDQPGNLDCQCFANVSGSILAHEGPRVARAYYADKKELARGQASHAC